MKRCLCLLIVMLFLLRALHVKAQNYDDPAVYMKAVGNAQNEFTKIYMSYISAAWHSSRATKIERLRDKVVENLTTSRYKIIDLPIYKGDNSLRKSNIDYLWLLTKVFNDDYKHLVNMEELIDQSFDQMELYLLLKEKINDTLKAANDRIGDAEKAFAAKYNVTLIDNKSDASQKMELANKVTKYHNKVYLLLFKCEWEEGLVMDAMEKKNITKTEQARNALVKYAGDGIAGLDSLSSYDNDASLAGACKQTLTFFQKEAETHLSKISDYLLKQENFGKIKAAFDAKPKSSQTQQDIDGYNKAVSDLNAALALANQAFKDIVVERNKTIANWNNVEQKFSDAHMPYYR